jgi:hypothetical protein
MLASAAVVGALWATVNICNTSAHPDTIGIRASMPGTPRGARAAMRFEVQYQTPAGWQVVTGTDSGWRAVGAARGRALQYGWSFQFAIPPQQVTLRGVVRFRWRRQGKTVRSARRTTTAGHHARTGGDPPGYSAATCALGS